MMPISLEQMNDWIRDNYGLFENGQPNYRIVWSDTEVETRKGMFHKYDDHGNYLGLQEEVRIVPKYAQWIHHKYVLEKIVPTGELNLELSVNKLSYEPLWVFEDKHGKPLPPKKEAIALIIKTVQEQLANAGKGPRYPDPDSNPEEALALKEKRIERLELDLFGNETQTATALAHQRGVVVPNNYGDN